MITRTSRGTKRFVAAAAAVAMIGSTLAITSAASAAQTGAAIARVSGLNRNATAVAAAPLATSNPAEIVIVNGLDFPDGLTASIYNQPILLVSPDAIPTETSDYIKAVQASTVNTPNITVVGGTTAVSSAVFEDLAKLNGTGTTVRVSGGNRYATSLAVATANLGGGTSVIIATGLTPADALSAGPLAIAGSQPIILNDGPSLSAEVIKFLTDKGIQTVTIVGGEAAVPATVETELASAMGITVTRLAGPTRDATAAKITAAAGNITQVNLVNRDGFADALAAGPFSKRAPLGGILTAGVDSLPAETAAFLQSNCDTITTVNAMGGIAVISQAVLLAAQAATVCEVPGISSAALTVTKVTQRVIVVGDVATPGQVAGDATSPRLTSVLGSAASGPAAAGYEVVFAASSTPAVAINATTKVITFTDNFTSLTRAQFVANWNASVAGALFTATPGTAATDFTLQPLGSTGLAATANVTVAGSYDASLVVTFDQAVYGVNTVSTPLSKVYNNSNLGAAGTVLLQTGTVSPTAVVATVGVTTVTEVYTGQTTAVPTAFSTVRYAVSSVSNLANGQGNIAVLMSTITVN